MTRTVTVDKDIKALELANKGFYAAFESLDIRKMDAVWVQKDHVKCVHPGWEIRIGWPDVRDSWVLILITQARLNFPFACLIFPFRGIWPGQSVTNRSPQRIRVSG